MTRFWYVVGVVTFYHLGLIVGSLHASEPFDAPRPVKLTAASMGRSLSSVDALSGLERSQTLPSPSVAPLDASAVESIREVYVWAWPMMYLSNLKESLELIRSPGTSGGAPVAPVNSLCMLTNVVPANFKSVPCPNPDVIYGFGMMDLEHEPVIVQVPEFKDRFWMYQVGDHRMDSFAELGSMYESPAGFYLIVGPNWNGPIPSGIRQVLRSPTNLAYVLPRVVASQSHTASADDAELLGAIAMYPLSRFNGQLRRIDWRKSKWYPAIGRSSRHRSKLVNPETFFEQLPSVLDQLEPLEAERNVYQLAKAVTAAAAADAHLAARLRELARHIENETIVPMFDFHNVGSPLNGRWRTITKGAAFAGDYWSRTAVAKSNTFVNREHEAKYYYLEQSAEGLGLSGENAYRLTFPPGASPPHNGFWSLTAYDNDHHLQENSLQRYSVGSLSGELKTDADGSLTIWLQPEQPDASQQSNWLPTPSGAFVLYLRVYAPQQTALDGRWTPAAVERITR